MGGWSNIYFANGTDVLYELYVIRYGDGDYIAFNGKACTNREFIELSEEIDRVKGEKKQFGGTIVG